MYAIILQARLDSTRLPEKTMLPLGGRPLILRVMEALNLVPADLRILACSEDSAGVFTPLAAEACFELFPGPKDDVLKRYCLAVERFGIQQVIRATGDNPFVFTDAATAINAEALALHADYAGYNGIPAGAGVESVSATALLRADIEADEPFEREHVCPYLYSRPNDFLVHRPLAPLRWQNWSAPQPRSAPQPLAIRLTVDTREDYERAQTLYTELDRQVNAGLPRDERYRGATIISAYRGI